MARSEESIERNRAYSRLYRAANLDRVKAIESAYSERRKALNRKNYQDNKARYIAYAKKWRAANPDKVRLIKRAAKATRRAKQQGSAGKLTPGILRKLFFLQKGRCVVCTAKFSKKPGSYHLDHIMPLALSGSHTDDNLQLLCPSCNIAKGAKHPMQFMQAQGFLL